MYRFSKFSWALGDQVLQFVGQLASIFVLTRIISPEGFGIFAIATIIISIVQQVLSLGFTQALIQFDNHKEYYSTAWTVNLIIALVVTIIVILLFPTILDLLFNKYLAYTVYFQLFSLSIFLSSLGNIGVVELYRNLDLRKLILLRGVNKVSLILITICCYIILNDFRSLFAGFIINLVFKVVLTYLIAPIKSRIGFNITKFRKIYTFGGWLQLKNIIKVFYQQIDSMFVGNMMSLAELGFYNRALTIANTQDVVITNLNTILTFPYLSKKKNNRSFIERIFELSYNVIIIIISIVIIIIFCYGEIFIDVVFGSNWKGISEPLNILIISGGISSLLISFFPFLRALGHTKTEFKLYSIKIIILLSVVYPFVRLFGMLGGAYASLLSNIFVMPFFINILAKKVKFKEIRFYFTFLIYGFISFLMILLYDLILEDHLNIFFGFFLQIVLFICLSITFHFFIFRDSYFKAYIVTLLFKR